MTPRAQENAQRAMDFLAEVLQAPDAFPDEAVVLPLDEDLASTLSPSRVRLLRRLRDHGPAESLGALADALGRDLGAVSRDVTLLEGLGLVERERTGKEKRVSANPRLILVW